MLGTSSSMKDSFLKCWDTAEVIPQLPASWRIASAWGEFSLFLLWPTFKAWQKSSPGATLRYFPSFKIPHLWSVASADTASELFPSLPNPSSMQAVMAKVLNQPVWEYESSSLSHSHFREWMGLPGFSSHLSFRYKVSHVYPVIVPGHHLFPGRLHWLTVPFTESPSGLIIKSVIQTRAGQEVQDEIKNLFNLCIFKRLFSEWQVDFIALTIR